MLCCDWRKLFAKNLFIAVVSEVPGRTKEKRYFKLENQLNTKQSGKYAITGVRNGIEGRFTAVGFILNDDRSDYMYSGFIKQDIQRNHDRLYTSKLKTKELPSNV